MLLYPVPYPAPNMLNKVEIRRISGILTSPESI
jgi:hypothetical protein